MQMIRKKIRSQRGASITYALLLFLVCAVIGSLVLVAGFAAAGRVVKLAEAEQRYYAVNSAAEYVLSELCGEDNKVTVGIKKNSEDSDYTVILPGDSSKASNLAKDLAKVLVFGTLNLDTADLDTADKEKLFKKCSKNVTDKKTEGEITFWDPHPFVYELKVDGIQDVQVEAKFINGYQLNLTIKTVKQDGETEAEQYILPTIILETESPRGMNDTDTYEYTFNWKTPKG